MSDTAVVSVTSTKRRDGYVEVRDERGARVLAFKHHNSNGAANELAAMFRRVAKMAGAPDPDALVQEVLA